MGERKQPRPAPGTLKTTERARRLAAIFEEWDRRYRDNPDDFMSVVEYLLGNTPKTYGEGAAAYFMKLERELA